MLEERYLIGCDHEDSQGIPCDEQTNWIYKRVAIPRRGRPDMSGPGFVVVMVDEEGEDGKTIVRPTIMCNFHAHMEIAEANAAGLYVPRLRLQDLRHVALERPLPRQHHRFNRLAQAADYERDDSPLYRCELALCDECRKTPFASSDPNVKMALGGKKVHGLRVILAAVPDADDPGLLRLEARLACARCHAKYVAERNAQGMKVPYIPAGFMAPQKYRAAASSDEEELAAAS